jgi:hypothetical protein
MILISNIGDLMIKFTLTFIMLTIAFGVGMIVTKE